MEVSSRTISNKVINALLEAIYDVLDRDGKESVLSFANLDYMKENLPTNGDTPYNDFIKLIETMNFLLAHSTKAKYEIGRKFSFYLSPFGNKVSEFIDLLESTISNELRIDLEKTSEDMINVEISNCPFCSGNMIGFEQFSTNIQSSNHLCPFFSGVLIESIKKSAEKELNYQIKQIEKSKDRCKFIISLF